jgi:hypothetical protein
MRAPTGCNATVRAGGLIGDSQENHLGLHAVRMPGRFSEATPATRSSRTEDSSLASLPPASMLDPADRSDGPHASCQPNITGPPLNQNTRVS